MSRKFNQIFHESGSWKKQMVFPNIEMTPELASEFLRLNGRNRPVSDTFVKQYVKAMLDKRWIFNGDSIRISREGLIVDGQKKLLAVIESGCTQTFNVQTGLAPESFEVMDIGQMRSASDTLAVAGFPNYNVMAGAIKLILAYKSGQMKQQAQGSSRSVKFSNSDVREFAEGKMNKDLMNEATTYGNKFAYRAKFFSPSTYAAFYYMMAEIDHDACLLFFEMLTSGENISSSSYSSVWLLRKRLIEMMKSSMVFRTADKYALLIKAWNYFKNNREIKQLSWQPREDFPQIQ
jgi:hypothetical protein